MSCPHSGTLLEGSDYVRRPDDSTVIWRYVDLSLFLFLLDSTSIHFSTLHELRRDDPGEGSIASALLFELTENQHEDVQHAYMDGYGPQKRDELQQANLLSRKEVRSLGISCWHHSDSECVAMWKLYTSGFDGVAIQSTVAAVRDAVPPNRGKPACGFVRYEPDLTRKDLEKTLKPVETVFVKRRVRQHEREVRFVLGQHGQHEGGFDIGVKLPDLVHKIFLGHKYPQWAKPPLEKFIERRLMVKPSESSIGGDARGSRDTHSADSISRLAASLEKPVVPSEPSQQPV